MGRIAAKFGLTLYALERLNPQITNPNLIYPGQKIRVK
jgi:LysM repeat protein